MTDKSVTSPLGLVVRNSDGMRLEFVRHFPDSIERVWSAATDPDELSAWYGTWRGDPSTGWIELSPQEAGGQFYPTEVVECEPPRKVSIIAPSPDGPWPLSIALTEADDGGTTLVFVHHLAEPYDATSVGPGWHYYVDRLSAHLTGTELPEDWSLYEPLGPSYPLPD